MPVNVVMPQMGESIFEGTVTKWLKKPGESVARDEPLFEISTDKVDAEVPSPASGVLREIKVPEGQTVQVNTVVALLDGEGEAAAPAETSAPAVQAKPAAAEAASPIPAAPSAPAAAAPMTPPSPAAAKAAPPDAVEEKTEQEEAEIERGEVRSSPLVRRLAKENQVDLSQVRGTGIGGRVSKHDLMQYLEQRKGAPAPAAAAPAAAAPARPTAPGTPAVPGAPVAAAPSPAPARPGAVEIVPMSLMRKRIAEHMVMSKRTSPHVYSVFQADMSRIARLRDEAKNDFENRHGTRLTFMPFFAVAAIEALKRFPIVNSSVQEESIVYKKDINLGIAVALDWGLLVPVIKHAEEKNFLGLQRAINDLAARARSKKLSPDEVQDGTFSITNPGIFGGLFGLPVINQPQVAILGIGGIHKTPVVVDDAIAIRSIVHLTLSFDHRVIDGAVADQFLASVVETLEKWNQPLS